jgi:hypothetical protein
MAACLYKLLHLYFFYVDFTQAIQVSTTNIQHVPTVHPTAFIWHASSRAVGTAKVDYRLSPNDVIVFLVVPDNSSLPGTLQARSKH